MTNQPATATKPQSDRRSGLGSSGLGLRGRLFPMADSIRPICVIGAGPAGLCAGAALRARGVPFQIVDEAESVGGIWDIDRGDTPMYDSAHFISSKRLSAFPGFPMPDDYPDYPRHDQILSYVRDFARTHDLGPSTRLGIRVRCAEPVPGGFDWRVSFDSGEEKLYSGLCVATGSTWHPVLPEVAGRFEGTQLHSFEYRSPELLRGKRVLVVGAGNSGCDIACDAARVAGRAMISMRRGYHFVPKYVLGKPADEFAHRGPRLPARLEQRVFRAVLRVLVGDLGRYGLPRPDHDVLESHPIMNTEVLHHMGHGRLMPVAGIEELRSGSVRFSDGREEEVDVILWATGYRRIFPFFDAPELNGEGEALDLYLNVFHRRHRTLFFMGLFETDGAAYGLFGLQAELVAGYLADRMAGSEHLSDFEERRLSHRPDPRGGRRYLDTTRHRYYVRGHTYRRILLRARRRWGWG